MGEAIDVGVFGASGYVGGELLRLLLNHPHVGRIAPVSESLARLRVDGPHPNLRRVTDLTFVTPDEMPACDVVFLATPHLTAMRLLPGLSASVSVIDLSADFRLRDPEIFERYYGVPHAAADRVAAAVSLALGARALVFLTGVPGVLADLRDRTSVLARYRVPAHADTAIGSGMAVKLAAAEQALVGGVPQVVIAGDGDRPVSRALNGEAGTSIVLA